MVIDFKKLTLLPCAIIFVLAMRICISFTANEMLMISYAVLAIDLMSASLMAFLFLKKGSINFYLLTGIVYLLTLLTSTVLNGADIKECFYLCCDCMLILMVMDYYRLRFDMVVMAFAAAFSLCIYLNFLHLMTHPQLWFNPDSKENIGYLLGGNYNQIGSRILCALATSFCCLRISKWWLANVIPLVIVSLATLFIVQSMTSLSCIIIFLLLCITPSKRLQRIGIYSIFTVYVLFQVFVCFAGEGIEHNEYAVYFVEDVLGKDITFTLRIYVWDAALKVFFLSPILGHGMVNADWFYSNMYAQAMGPHNFILSVMINGGIVLLLLFIFLFVISVKNTLVSGSRSANIVLSAIAVFMMMMTMEMYPFTLVLYMLALAHYFPWFEQCCRPKQEPEETLPGT